MYKDLLWASFNPTIASEICINRKKLSAIVLKRPLETDLETGSAYKTNKTVLVLDPTYTGQFHSGMDVLIEDHNYKIKEVFEYLDEIRVEVLRAKERN
ncbi:hypothetical protein CMO94_02420 [Candidatus Woesearchaeota archaeon]|nr:hypothetical protein [Candidatus Woesearchaeota archaeon]